MAKIIGFNLDQTYYGLPLDNGGVALFVDGEIKMMINEERLNRKKYSNGFKESINYVLGNNDLSIEDIDFFVASSCLEPLSNSEVVRNRLLKAGLDIPLEKIKIVDHHLSHAYTAFFPSPFDKAIIMVLDGDGNILSEKMAEGTDTQNKYWLNKTDHHSYFIGEGNNVTFLEKDNIDIGENGVGGAYRYFTYFCGFPGYKYAGKLMGLSAYGSQRNKYKNIKIFDVLDNGQLKCYLPDNNRVDSPKVVENWLQNRGVNLKARRPTEPITEDIEDIAFLIQRELDKALILKVKYLVKKTEIKNLCIAGGVGLNAVTNRAILDNTGIENIFIQPAAGDSGQPLGNAYYGVNFFDKKNMKRKQLSIYQGKKYSDDEISNTLEKVSKKIKFKKLSFNKIASLAAKKLADNKIIAWFQDGSEIGPRALGNRSILANPISKKMKDVINAKVKHRESFRPFAPSVLEEKANEWFDINIPAPYMILNAQVKQQEKVPSITHLDGSARLQTVNKSQNEKYYKLISEFNKLTGVPILINTSFNDNEPIVESPEDAVNTFLRTQIDYLVLGNYFVEKSIGS